MIESEDGTVTGSIDVSRLGEVEPKTDEARAQLDALKGEAQAGQDQANADAQKLAEQFAAQNPQADVPPDDRDAQGVPVDDGSNDQSDGSNDQADEPESEDRDQLRAEAEELGVQVDRRWGVDRLRQEIDTAR